MREHLSSLRTFFEHLCAVAEFFPFDLWGPQVVDFMLKVLEPTLPPPRHRVATRTRRFAAASPRRPALTAAYIEVNF